MSSSLLSAALDDATRVVKKQKTTSSVTAQAIEGALRVLEEAQAKCDEVSMTTTTSTGQNNANGILAAAAEALKGADASGVVAAATKDLHGAVGKLGKVRKKKRWRERKRGKERATRARTTKRAATGTENPFSSKRPRSPSPRKRCAARSCRVRYKVVLV